MPGSRGRVQSEDRSRAWCGPARSRLGWARRAGCARATTVSTTASWSPSSVPGAARRPPSSTAAASQTSSTAAASRAATFPTSTATCGVSGGQGRWLAGRGPGRRAVLQVEGQSRRVPRPAQVRSLPKDTELSKAGEGSAEKTRPLGDRCPGSRDSSHRVRPLPLRV